MNIDTYRKCTNWNIGYRIDVLTPEFSIYRKPVWYSSRDVPNNNLEDVCQWLIKFTINSQFASSNSCLLSLSACHTWSHTCLDRARWSARRGRLLIHLPQAIPIPASAFNMNDCLLVTSSHGIENAQIGISVIVSMCWHRYFRYIENRYDTLAEMYQITIWKMYVSGSLNSLSTRNLHQVIPASCLWVPVTPGRTPAWTEHGDQPGVAGYSSICLRQFRFLHQLSTWTTASSSHHLMASASRPPPPPPRGPQDRRGVWENGSSPCRKYHCWDLQGTREAIQIGLHFLGEETTWGPGTAGPSPETTFSGCGTTSSTWWRTLKPSCRP